MIHKKAQAFYKIVAREWSERDGTIHRYTEIIHIMRHVSQKGANFSHDRCMRWSEHNEIIQRYNENIRIMGHVSKGGAKFS
jgi:Tat protein secretion system quality control protein TatD with DNase activity